MPVPPPANGSRAGLLAPNGSVEKAVNEASLARSVQSAPPQTTLGYSAETLPLFFVAQQADDMIPWGTNVKGRDQQLRQFIPTEPLFASALGIIAARNASFSWKLDGPERTVTRYHKILQQAAFGKGWAHFVTRLSVDLYTSDSGAFFEIIRDGNSPDSSLVGIANLDAARCFPTGIPEFPVVYQDRNGAYHRLAWYQVGHILELPAPYEGLPDLQYCALSRMLSACRRMRDIGTYLAEKVGGRSTRAIALLKGITPDQVSAALNVSKIQHDAERLYRFSMPVMVGSLDPKAEVGFDLLELASLPDGFDLDLSEKQYIAQIAMAFMTDYQDFAPLPGGNLGTSAQSEVLHMKSRGKGPALFMKVIAEQINWNLLPENVEFLWDEQDPEADKQADDARLVRANTRSVRIASGEITPAAARQLAYDEGDLPLELLEQLNAPATDITEPGELLVSELPLPETEEPTEEAEDVTVEEGAQAEAQRALAAATADVADALIPTLDRMRHNIKAALAGALPMDNLVGPTVPANVPSLPPLAPVQPHQTFVMAPNGLSDIKFPEPTVIIQPAGVTPELEERLSHLEFVLREATAPRPLRQIVVDERAPDGAIVRMHEEYIEEEYTP